MKKQILIISFIFLLGIGVGVIGSQLFVSREHAHGDQVRQGGYSLINPLLECEIGDDILSKEFTTFRFAIEDEINRLQSAGDVDEMAVYYRDLNTGMSIGIEVGEEFSPASLLKIPVMLAYYKQAERDPSLLKKKFIFTGNQDMNQIETFAPQSELERGKEYTVEQLIKQMLVYSDNNAMALLVNNMPIELQDQVFQDLGITIPGVKGTEDFMTVREYASFFRILYNASYLSRDNSQKALELLSEVDFENGIRAGVPQGMNVANKFGERTFNNVDQLHDCGIVYYNDHPYLICIMSRGTDFTKLANSIQAISRVIYEQVDQQVATHK